METALNEIYNDYLLCVFSQFRVNSVMILILLLLIVFIIFALLPYRLNIYEKVKVVFGRKKHIDQGFLSLVLNETNVFFMSINENDIITKMNKFAEEVTCLSALELVGKSFRNMPIYDISLSFIEQAIEDIKKGIEEIKEKSISINRNNKNYEFILKVSKVKLKDSYEVVFLGIDITDIMNYELQLRHSYDALESSTKEISVLQSELKKNTTELAKNDEELRKRKEELQFLEYHDYLTQLPNRLHFCKKTSEDLLHEKSGAIITIDIDNFQFINDTLGHEFGDELLKAIAMRLACEVSRDSFLARLGGDEFVIHVKNINSIEQIENSGNKILNIFNDTFLVLGSYIKVTASIGVSYYPQDGTNCDELLKKSDIAMQQSKFTGKNRFTFFNEGMKEEIIEKKNIEEYLINALKNDEFILHYQPQVDAKTERIIGFEALIRWNSPKLGLVSPLKFIKIAEDNHMIIDIGNWVIKNACEFIKEVNENGIDKYTISVNVSVLQLMQSNFVENTLRIIEEVGISANWLEIEITETIFINSYNTICQRINTLTSVGIRISLDDFGTGYSSLGYLKQLPINVLKVDKSFIDDIYINQNSCLVEDIIIIGHKLGLTVIAEGVESKEQLQYLKSMNCDTIQGFLFSKPLPRDVAKKLIKEASIIN